MATLNGICGVEAVEIKQIKEGQVYNASKIVCQDRFCFILNGGDVYSNIPDYSYTVGHKYVPVIVKCLTKLGILDVFQKNKYLGIALRARRERKEKANRVI